MKIHYPIPKVKPLGALNSRLRDTHGFMLVEQLVSIIFIGLLCIVVAAGLGAAMSAYGSITKQTRADAMLSQAVELVSDELVYALEVEGDGAQDAENVLYFTSATRHEIAALQSDERGIWLNAQGEQALLAPAKDALVPSLDKLEYQSSSGTWSFLIQIKSGTDTLAEANLTVHRIGS